MFYQTEFVVIKELAEINSENLFPERETKLVALGLQHLAQSWVATEENRDLSNLLLSYLCKHLVPVGPACIRPRLQSSDQVSTSLFVEEIHRHLKKNRLHISLLKCRCHIHVHLEEPAQGASDLGLFYLELGEKVDKPWKQNV